MSWSKALLPDEPVKLILETPAVAFGVTESVILQHIHYRSNPDYMHSPDSKVSDGITWVRVSARQWSERYFPYWGKTTINRLLKKLVDHGLLLTRIDLNEHAYDKTIWYSINKERFDEILDLYFADPKGFSLKGFGPVPFQDTLSQSGTSSSEVGVPETDTLSQIGTPPLTQSGTAAQRDPSQSGTTILKKEEGNGISSIQENWSSFLELVASQTSKDVFHASFQGSRPAAIDESVLVIETPGQRETDWINNRVGEIALSAFLAANPGTDIEKLWARPWRSK